jgi:hypothetical protein
MWGAIISGVTSLASSYMDNRKIKTEHNEWYQWSFMGAVAASLGIRWAFKFFSGKK